MPNARADPNYWIVVLWYLTGGLELGLEWAGLGPVKWQVEIDKSACFLLEQKWPKAKRCGDVRSYLDHDLEPVEIIVGGDPCQCRSLAKGKWKTTMPDLSGYFLAVIGRLRPRWVVRENVSAPDVVDFKAALEYMGYGAVVAQYNGEDFTSQSRKRHFIIGSNQCTGRDLESKMGDSTSDKGNSSQTHKEKSTVAACLTTHPYRYSESDNLVYEDGSGLRLLSAEERERLQGFPTGWTAGLSF